MTQPVANVSIICANYNNGSYLEACIESVVASTMHPTEMIVVDDGSSLCSQALEGGSKSRQW